MKLKKQFAKSFTSVLLCIALVACCLPLAAFAGAGDVAVVGKTNYTSLQKAFDDVPAGETVTLLDNVILSDSIIVSGDLTLDLAGKSISQAKAQTSQYSMIVNNGTLVIKDSVGGGRISYTDSGNGGEYVSNTILNNGTLTVESGRIENLSNSTVASNGYPQTIDTNGALIVTNGEIYCENYSSVRIWCTTDDNTSVSISGGMFTGSVDLHNVNNNANKGELAITGGTFKPNDFTTKVLRLLNFGSDTAEMKMTISGNPVVDGDIGVSGSVQNIDLAEIVEVTGGTFSSNVSAYVPAEYTSVSYKNGEGTTVYGIAKSGNVAINTATSAEYTDLQAALNAAEEGQTVKLLGNVIVSQPINITGAVTLDGDGSVITYTGTDRAIDVPNSTTNKVNVTIQNLTVVAEKAQRGINYNDDGLLTLTDVAVKGNGGKEVPAYAVNFPGKSTGATVVITDCELVGNIALNAWGQNMTITVTDTAMTSVDAVTAENYTAVKLNNDGVTVAENTIITITGGSIKALNEMGNPSGAISNATLNGQINIGDTTDVVGDIVEIVAVIRYEDGNSYSFTSLQDAIDRAVADGEDVTILRNVMTDEIITVSGAVAINGNGCTLTSSAGRAINVDTDEEVTINELAIVGKEGCQRGINIINQAGTTNLNKVTVSDISHYAVHVAISAGAATVNIDESDLTGYAALAVYGAGTTVNVTDTDLIGINPYEDNGSNSFATIAVGAAEVSIAVSGGTVSAESTEGLAAQMIIGANSGSSPDLTVTLDTELVKKGTATIIGLDSEDEYALKVREEYADELLTEGFATKATATKGLITLDKATPVYTVTYKADGEVIATVKVAQGQNAVAPAVPVKEGYTGSWSEEGTNVTADIEITAIYKVIENNTTTTTEGTTTTAESTTTTTEGTTTTAESTTTTTEGTTTTAEGTTTTTDGTTATAESTTTTIGEITTTITTESTTTISSTTTTEGEPSQDAFPDTGVNGHVVFCTVLAALGLGLLFLSLNKNRKVQQ